MALDIGPLGPGDHARWRELWRGYLTFYATTLPEDRYDSTWRRLLEGREIAGLGAHADGTLVGITHYLFHHHAWSDDVCYLQDLFVDASVRSRGVGRRLIEGVAAISEARGCAKLYWMTSQANATARRLYDQIAVTKNHIRYDYVGDRA